MVEFLVRPPRVGKCARKAGFQRVLDANLQRIGDDARARQRGEVSHGSAKEVVAHLFCGGSVGITIARRTRSEIRYVIKQNAAVAAGTRRIVCCSDRGGGVQVLLTHLQGSAAGCRSAQ